MRQDAKCSSSGHAIAPEQLLERFPGTRICDVRGREPAAAGLEDAVAHYVQASRAVGAGVDGRGKGAGEVGGLVLAPAFMPGLR